MTKKKTWKKPELIVLVRGKPDEAILQGCKEALAVIDADRRYNTCNEYTISFRRCANWPCLGIVAS